MSNGALRSTTRLSRHPASIREMPHRGPSARPGVRYPGQVDASSTLAVADMPEKLKEIAGRIRELDQPDRPTKDR